MMMPRKKRRTLIIVSIIMIILVIIGTLIFLYMTTDAFKSNDTLFAKYLSQNFYIIEEMQNQNGMKEANTLLENNKYTSTIQANVNYITNKGLEDEKKDNPINQVELKIEGQTDKLSYYKYKDIKLIKQEENLERAEYIETKDRQGIRLDEVKQFVTFDKTKENQNISQLDLTLLKTISNISEINWNNIKETFTQEEINTIMNKYMNIIMANMNAQAFEKKTGNITINESAIKTNAYTISITKEQFNNIYIEILEAMKQDEIILNKIDMLNTKIKEITNSEQGLKQTFIEYIANKIEEIRSTNIGQEIREITVYEKNGQTMRTEIVSDEYQFRIDRLINQNGIWLEISYQKQTEKQNGWKINTMLTSKENEENNYIGIENAKDGILNYIEINNESKMENNRINSQVEAKAYNEKNEVTLTAKQTDTIVNKLENIVELNEENNINIEDLKEEEKNNILLILDENIKNQTSKLEKIVTLKDAINMLINVDLMKESMGELTESGIVTEAEKNRFNAIFEFYEGEKIEIEDIKKMMNVVKDHLKEIKIMEYEEQKRKDEQPKPKKYLIVIEKDKKNEELANLLVSNLENEKNSSDEYNVKIEYNEENGLIKNIILSIAD